MKLNSTATDYLFSTYLGGTMNDYGDSNEDVGWSMYFREEYWLESNITLDHDDNIYFLGATSSRDFPLNNPLRVPAQTGPTDSSVQERFVAKFSPTGDIKYSTFLNAHWWFCSSRAGISVDKCGNMLVSGFTLSREFPLLHPLQGNLSSSTGFNYLTVISAAGDSLRLSTQWGGQLNGTQYPYQIVKSDDAGYVYLSGESTCGDSKLDSAKLPLFHDFQSQYRYKDGYLTRLFMPFCNQDYLACNITGLDTLNYETNRDRYVRQNLTIKVTVKNTDVNKPAEDVSVELRLPETLQLYPDSQSFIQPLVPSTLLPGASQDVYFTVRTVPRTRKDTTMLVHALVQYRDVDIRQSCPLPYIRSSAPLPVHFVAIPFPKVSCFVSAPDTLIVDSTGNTYADNPFTVSCAVVNSDTNATLLKSATVHLPKGMGLTTVPPEDTLRTLSLLGAKDTATVSWTVKTAQRNYDWKAGISCTVIDGFDSIITICVKEIIHPSVGSLACSVTAPGTITYMDSTNTYTPNPFAVFLHLKNYVDTVFTNIEAQIDFSQAPLLSVASGDSVPRSWPVMYNQNEHQFIWNVQVDPSLDSTSTQKIIFKYRCKEASEWKTCEADIYPKINGKRALLTCSLAAPDSLALNANGNGFLVNPFTALFSLKNIGLATSWLDHATLSLAAGLAAMTDTSQHVAELAPSASENASWQIVAHTSRFSRIMHLSATAVKANGTIVSRCMKDMFLPGIPNDIVCSIAAPDTIHYDVATDTYTPNPIPLTLTLDNKLDTAQQIIETIIDLTSAPHLKLASGEQAQKQIAGIAAHSPAAASWQLEVAASVQAPIMEHILVKYRNASDTSYKSCGKDIFIQGEKRIYSASCKTAGHDSIWLLEDKTVPLVAQVQYTISNTGNVPLSGCNAAIILPAMFYCANSADSIQSFGVIQPGRNVSRQWLIAVNLSLAQLAQQTIRWAWSCDSIASIPPCEHHITPVLGEPTRIVLSPWKLRFRAEQNGALPAAQQVLMQEGSGASIFWQLQSSTAWIDYLPSTGSQTTSVTVRPNTTSMPASVYNGTIGITPALLVSPQASIEVEYEIRLTSPTCPTPAPNTTTLSQSYPNPVSSGHSTVIGFSLERAGYASIKLYDFLGRQVATVFDGNATSDAHSVSLDVSMLRSGMYTYVLITQERVLTRSFMVIR